MTITALNPTDGRTATIAVAGSAALLVAKLHKLGERRGDPGRLVDKDAHDVYRLLVATNAQQLARRLDELSRDELAGASTRAALSHLRELFVSAGRPGAVMAGRAEELVGDPDVVTAAVTVLSEDVLEALGNPELSL